jgi:hypothetical protein
MVVTEEDVIIIHISPEAMARAQERARLKQNHVDTWLNRTTEERREDFLYGQLGEEGFRVFLEQNSMKYKYYDDIRTDSFQQIDLYDFKLLDANDDEIAEVSVKSSIMDWELEPTIRIKNILAYPNEVKAITVQPFVDVRNRIAFLCGWEKKDIMERMPIGPLSHSSKAMYHKRRVKDAIPMIELVNYYRELCNKTRQQRILDF